MNESRYDRECGRVDAYLTSAMEALTRAEMILSGLARPDLAQGVQAMIDQLAAVRTVGRDQRFRLMPAADQGAMRDG